MRNSKPLSHTFVARLLLLVALTGVAQGVMAPRILGQENSLSISASAGILVDVSSGEVLWSKNPDQRRPVASTTKIMTALLVLENVSLEETVTTSETPPRVGGGDQLVVRFGLVAGERARVEDLLFALMLQSANDAAVALAEHVGGSVSDFAKKMNERAAELGAGDTRFVNPHGLDEPGQFSTARDLATISRAALNHPTFRRIVGSESQLVVSSHRQREIENRNEMLSIYPGATGIKTGTTEAAGRALVASAARADEERIAVVLSTETPNADASKLLDYGLDNFKRVDAAKQGDVWGVLTFADGVTFEIVVAESVSVLLPSGDAVPQTELAEDGRFLTVRTVASTVSVDTEFRCEGAPCPIFAGRESTIVDDIWRFLTPVAELVDGWLVGV